MYVVTGGACFVGSHIVRRLSARGITNILVVDNMPQARPSMARDRCLWNARNANIS